MYPITPPPFIPACSTAVEAALEEEEREENELMTFGGDGDNDDDDDDDEGVHTCMHVTLYTRGWMNVLGVVVRS